jgi:asparagine synthase (glutamine-hydrolysing)
MCGIAGVVSSTRPSIDRETLAAMAAMLDHRGPDGRGLHVEPYAGLAHTRLSILDLQLGAQPMSSEDGSLWITFNGEIFNYVELRRDLVSNGHHFRTTSDTEVLLRLFQQDGEKALQKLNGQWAFAVWNGHTRELFVSRDPLGVRPLFYTFCGDRLLFASEIKALFADPAVTRTLDPHALDNVFTFWTTLPGATAFAGIHSLPPGHSLTWCDGRLTIRPYWAPSFSSTNEDATEALAADALRAALDDATRIRLRADVPVGAYLSGGLDSSMIVALMKRAGIERPKTFAIAFDQAEFDESLYQRQAAKALDTDHHELRCPVQDIANVFPDVVWHAETPLVRTAPAPLFLLSRLARERGCNVVLTGEGADEMFGGYDIFKEAKVRRFCLQNPASTRRASLVKRLYPYLPDLQQQPARFVRSFFNDGNAALDDPCFSHRPRWRTTGRMKMFLSDAMRESLDGYDGARTLEAMLPPEHAGWHPFCQAQYLETAHLLPGYLLSSQGDRMAMAHGVEGRYPFLDRQIVALAATLPPRLKMKVLNEKYLLKQIARDLVPTAVWRRHKQPYRAPGARALVAAAGTYVDDLLSPAQLRRDGIFHPDRVSRLVQKVRSSEAVSAGEDMALVGILSTQIIIDRFINHFSVVPHGSLPYPRAAEIHRG